MRASPQASVRALKQIGNDGSGLDESIEGLLARFSATTLECNLPSTNPKFRSESNLKPCRNTQARVATWYCQTSGRLQAFIDGIYQERK